MQQFASFVVAHPVQEYTVILILLKFSLQESALRDYGLGDFANTTTNDERGPVNESNVRIISPNMEFVARENIINFYYRS